MKIVLATHNHDKEIELRDSLCDLDVDICSLSDYPGIGEIEETAGAVVSITMALLAPNDPEEPGAGRVKLALLDALSRMVLSCSLREFVAL